ncbi:response regulator transcription factor [Cytobacillus oceanisediminis]|jgi:DNA-binding response OmpR family regulator|uniref:DNA-binding response regulator n=2 Tax=Cytobacillus oceanisediminis TaxID=665099 RepID=A0A160MDD4_9BACI|nr:response regulator transcription factor [Cytobacillus oceanisediminis]AND41067.1 DNA-binding response regulator [Cytobacillus oceanisediminis 2691]MBU8771183.1 response regulator transcription factor [Cytobacillus oceanisediminis]OHX48355.1 DNA-binding response regulator [Cytobacillus oceanisediminis]
MLNILIIDDEADMRHLIEMYLGNSGFTCFSAESGFEAYGILENNVMDLVILDIMMPGEDGFEVCSRIRGKSNVPIIFLSAKGEEWDKVKALQLGGDDYIVKPFSPGELIARMNAVLRRTGGLKSDMDSIQIGKITIDKKARKVTVAGMQVTLTLKEYELLLFFIEHKNQALSREQLLEYIWGIDYTGSLRTVDTHIKTLRMKLGVGDYIQTVWGVGYKFEVPSE